MLRRAWASLFAVIGLLPSESQAEGLLSAHARPLSAELLRIDWTTSDKTPDPDEAKALKDSCKGLAAALTVSNGPWGLGAFAHVQCGVASKNKGDQDQTGGVWLLKVRDHSGQRSFTFYYEPPDRKGKDRPESHQIAQILTKDWQWSPEFLKDPVFAALLAGALLDALPFAFAVPAEALLGLDQDVALSPQVRETARQLPRSLKPAKLLLFTLEYDAKTGFWETDVVGQAKLVQGRRTSHWRVHRRAAKSDTSRWVFGQRPDGPGSAQQQLLKAARLRSDALLNHEDEDAAGTLGDRMTDTLLRATIDNFGAGFLGVRYGRELVDPKTAVLPPATLIGVVAELHSGLFEGLRVYWDYIPKVSRSLGSDSISYTSSRVLVGYGLGFRPPWLLDRIELAPKVGAWNVKARFPLQEAPGQVTVLPFNSGNVLSVGADLSLEVESLRYLARAWGSRDVASAAFTKSQANGVAAQRAGGDLLLKGPRLFAEAGPFNLSFLLFGFVETVTITSAGQDPGSAGAGPTGAAAKPLSLGTSTAYGGGGMTISW